MIFGTFELLEFQFWPLLSVSSKTKKHQGLKIYLSHDASMATNGIFTDPWMIDFYGLNVGKHSSPMDASWVINL